MVFEIVHDAANPVDNWLPFYLMDRKSPKDFFKSYFCFMDLSKFKMQWQEADDEQGKATFRDFVTVFET